MMLGPNRKKSLVYPFSRKFAYYSLFLSATSVFITLALFRDSSVLLVYFLFVTALTVFFLLVKYRLYRKRTEKLFEQQLSSEKEGLKLSTLVITIVAGLIVVLTLYFILGPLYWFIFIDGFVAGVNLPELILYSYSRKLKSLKKG